MTPRKLALIATVAAIFELTSSDPSLAAEDCAQGNALNCYTQALVRLQASQDALEAATKSINSLQTQITALQSQMAANASSLQAQIAQQNATIAAYKNDAATALSNRIAQLNTGKDTVIQPGGNSGTAKCPPGSFLSGVNYQIDGGGPHGITSWLFAVCRNLN